MKILCVITFPTIHYAFKAEKVLKKNGITVDMIPVPREFSSSCGISISLPWEEKEKAIALLENDNIQAEGVYRREKN